ncbi:TRAP transporter large permease [Oceanicola sp. S124]|uniref:TRAP transporter large permease n=1 Tax=Oceanicola sp. S124 TaxID=1042378 RepID=UPI0002557E6C|nr:TRAP transporter large permease [Oceanicola sp. S124]
MTPIEIGLLGTAALFLLILLRMPIGFAMGVVGFAGFTWLTSLKAATVKLGVIAHDAATNYAIGTIPLFLLMAHILFASGFGKDLYDLAAKWLGQMRGGLAMATIGASSGFAAVNASSLATTATMGLVALPEMRKHNYDVSLACGSVAAGGTIGSLIPPSGMFIIYGILTETSIGALFTAGILPGILLALMYMTVIWIICRRNPAAGPCGPRTTWKEKAQSFGRSGEVVLLIILVIGGIMGGIFTPTEAGAVGAFGAVIIAAARGRFSWVMLKRSVYDTMKTTGMIFGILFGAFVFNSFITVSTIPVRVVDFVTGLEVARIWILLAILAVYFFLGMVLDGSAMMTLTVPLFFPVAMSLGFDPILFGVLVIRMTEIALITPPVGMNVFVLSGVARDIPVGKMFKGTAPFVCADVIHVALILIFPAIALWLPYL